MSSKEKFDNWNKVKQGIHLGCNPNLFVNQREVWYISNGENIGTESNGKGYDFRRPVLVLKKVGNLFFIVSMTTKGKINNRFYYNLDESYFGKKSDVILSQVKVVDKKRFLEYVGEISGEDFCKIKKELKNLLF